MYCTFLILVVLVSVKRVDFIITSIQISISKELNELNSLPLLFSLGPLVGKVKEYHVETIVDTLCSNMLSDNEQLRDISSIGEFG